MTCSEPFQTNPHAFPLFNITPFTLLDFPGHTACILWFAGCNMRCGYCHNPAIVKSKGRWPLEAAMAFLMKRQGLLDGVVLSGGEATIWPNLLDFMKTLKDMGFKIKLDTNGLRPDTIRAALDAHMVDYIAMDYKAPKSKFYTVTKSNHYASFSESLDLLCQQTSVPFEIRTTVHIEQLQEEDIVQIMHDLSARHFRGTYYIQNFVTANDRPNLGQLRPQSRYLNLDVLPLPRGYTLAFRNFPGILSRP